MQILNNNQNDICYHYLLQYSWTICFFSFVGMFGCIWNATHYETLSSIYDMFCRICMNRKYKYDNSISHFNIRVDVSSPMNVYIAYSYKQLLICNLYWMHGKYRKCFATDIFSIQVFYDGYSNYSIQEKKKKRNNYNSYIFIL